MYENKIIEEIEDVFVTELGPDSIFIIDQNLREMGLTRETFQITDVDDFVSHLLKEYDKILGKHVKILRTEIDDKFEE